MIWKLTEKDRRAVIEFAYRREKKNLKNDIALLVDHAVEKGIKIASVPCFKKYGDAVVRRLAKHRLKPHVSAKTIVLSIAAA